MVVMIATAIAAMIWTGHLNGGQNLVEDFANCSSSEALVFAGLVTVGFLLLLYLPRRVIGFKDFMNSVPEGGKLMMPAILILVLAWTLKGMTDALGIGTFVRSAINLNSSLMNFVPLVIIFSIFLAHQINKKIRGRTIYRTLLFIPAITIPAAIGILWRWILNYQYGIFNWILEKLGFSRISWLVEM